MHKIYICTLCNFTAKAKKIGKTRKLPEFNKTNLDVWGKYIIKILFRKHFRGLF